MNIIYNGQLINKEKIFAYFLDFEYLSGKYVKGYCWFFQGKFICWEETYFQLMASMRKMRFPIPLSYTPELFNQSMQTLVKNLNVTQARLEITIFNRAEQVDFIIRNLDHRNFYLDNQANADLYKGVTIYPSLLTGMFIFDPIRHICSQYCIENNLKEVLLLNYQKRIARANNGNLFLIQENNIILSNSLEEGAISSVLKKKFLSFLKEKTQYKYEERPFSSFECQQANEIFTLSDDLGMLSIKKIRNKVFTTMETQFLAKKFIGFVV